MFLDSLRHCLLRSEPPPHASSSEIEEAPFSSQQPLGQRIYSNPSLDTQESLAPSKTSPLKACWHWLRQLFKCFLPCLYPSRNPLPPQEKGNPPVRNDFFYDEKDETSDIPQNSTREDWDEAGFLPEDPPLNPAPRTISDETVLSLKSSLEAYFGCLSQEFQATVVEELMNAFCQKEPTEENFIYFYQMTLQTFLEWYEQAAPELSDVSRKALEEAAWLFESAISKAATQANLKYPQTGDTLGLEETLKSLLGS